MFKSNPNIQKRTIETLRSILMFSMLLLSIVLLAPATATAEASPEVKRRALTIAERVYAGLEIKWEYQTGLIDDFSDEVTATSEYVSASPYDLSELSEEYQDIIHRMADYTDCGSHSQELFLCDMEWNESANRQQQLSELNRIISNYKFSYENNPNLVDPEVSAAYKESRAAAFTLKDDLTQDLDTMHSEIAGKQIRAAQKMSYVRIFLATDDSS